MYVYVCIYMFIYIFNYFTCLVIYLFIFMLCIKKGANGVVLSPFLFVLPSFSFFHESYFFRRKLMEGREWHPYDLVFVVLYLI